jgi:hypothetical protein
VDTQGHEAVRYSIEEARAEAEEAADRSTRITIMSWKEYEAVGDSTLYGGPREGVVKSVLSRIAYTRHGLR